MVVTAAELAKNSSRVLDRVVNEGEVVEVQQQGRTVAEIRPRVGVNRSELLRLLRDRDFSPTDSEELRQAMDAASPVVGYAGRD